MRKIRVLVITGHLLDAFHDGFHKLFGSPERRFKKGLKKARKQVRSKKRELTVKKQLKSLARDQEDRLEFEKILKERIDGLQQNRQTLSRDNDIEI